MSNTNIAAHFYVNSMGEYGYLDENHNYLDNGGYIDPVEAKERGLTSEEMFAEQENQVLRTLQEKRLLDELRALAIDNGRWRANGGILYTEDPAEVYVHLTTEFQMWADDPDAWRTLRAVCADQGFEIAEIFSGEERGHWAPKDGLPATPENFNSLSEDERRALPTYVPNENEGRKWTRAECALNVHGKTKDEVEQAMARFEEATDALWRERGVSVL